MKRRFKLALKTFKMGEGGIVLPIVLVGLLLIGLLIPPLVGLITTSLVTGKMYVNSSHELYAADAGVMDAAWLLHGLELPGKGYINPEYIDDYFGVDGKGTYTYTMPELINDKTVAVEITMGGGGSYFTIISTATGADGSTTTIETRVEYPTPPPPIWVAVGALDGDLKISADVGIPQTPTVPGGPGWISIYDNGGDISMIGGSTIYGDAYHTPGTEIIQYPSSGVFYGKEIECAKLQLMLDIIPEKPATVWTGNMTINGGTITLGDIYITGSLSIGGTAKVILNGTVWVGGTISIASNSVVTSVGAPDEFEWLISDYAGKTGNAINVNGGTPDGYTSPYKVEAALYSPGGAIYIGGSSSLNGSAVGKSVDIQGTSRLANPLPFEPVPRDYEPMDYNYWKINS